MTTISTEWQRYSFYLHRASWGFPTYLPPKGCANINNNPIQITVITFPTKSSYNANHFFQSWELSLGDFYLSLMYPMWGSLHTAPFTGCPFSVTLDKLHPRLLSVFWHTGLKAINILWCSKKACQTWIVHPPTHTASEPASPLSTCLRRDKVYPEILNSKLTPNTWMYWKYVYHCVKNAF